MDNLLSGLLGRVIGSALVVLALGSDAARIVRMAPDSCDTLVLVLGRSR